MSTAIHASRLESWCWIQAKCACASDLAVSLQYLCSGAKRSSKRSHDSTRRMAWKDRKSIILQRHSGFTLHLNDTKLLSSVECFCSLSAMS